MGSSYVWGENPFQDFLIDLINNDVDISLKENFGEIYGGFIAILKYYVDDVDVIKHLDFKVIKSEESYCVIGENILSSLWISGIMPTDPHLVLKNNVCYVEKNKYVFDNLKKKLVVTIIDE